MGMGAATTYGRSTSDIISLNIPGKGGLPQALSSASRGASSFLDDISSVFNLGMDATTRLAIDGGLFAIEAGVCAAR
jgi:hypothetical protein